MTMGRPDFKSRRIPSRCGFTYRSFKVFVLVFLSAWLGVGLVTNGHFTIGGVPTPIVMSFLQDETARNAYFQGDRKKLHARLQSMGVEERVKAFYRPQISDEVKLDQYIHQILYERTGYVGDAYRLNQGVLVLKKK